MLCLATIAIYVGSHLSLSASQLQPEDGGMERMSRSDTYKFPIVGSIFLFSLYLVVKFVPKEYVNLVIKAYFFVFGVALMVEALHKWITMFVPQSVIKPFAVELLSIHIPYVSTPGKKTKVTALHLLSAILAAAIGVIHLIFNHWSSNNLLGMAFAMQGIEMLSLGSFVNGFVLLSLLFVYDVFWVFGTNVMVTVAKSIDGPIKLIFPKEVGTSMLGLGDIVVPGIFIALMLRLDEHLAKTSGKAAGHPSKHLPAGDTFYFNVTMVGYIVGLLATVAVMYWFEAAQPALLYLVPTCLGAPMTAAFLKGQFAQLWNFTETELPAPEKSDTVAKKSDAVTADVNVGTELGPATRVEALAPPLPVESSSNASTASKRRSRREQ